MVFAYMPANPRHTVIRLAYPLKSTRYNSHKQAQHKPFEQDGAQNYKRPRQGHADGLALLNDDGHIHPS